VRRRGVGSQFDYFLYNALGQRIKISGGVNGTVLNAYDEAGHLLGEYDATGALLEETVWLGNTPVATLRPSGATISIYYVHSDPLNTPRQVTRPSDNIPMWTWNADPFGTDAANPNPAGAGTFGYNLRFPGQAFDGQAGLHQNMARDYDPALGRYVESDPLGANAGPNTYGYVSGDPIESVDPMGLSSLEGSWITPPRLNLTGVQITNARLSVGINAWGHLELVNLYGNVQVYVNIDVRCTKDCQKWEIHDRVNLNAFGHVSLGPNWYATAIGLRVGKWWGALGANFAVNGAHALSELYRLLNSKASPLLSTLNAEGPTGICLAQGPR